MAASRALPIAAVFLLVCAAVPATSGQQAAPTPATTAQAAPAPTAADQRAQRLHADAARLNGLVEQLELELHKAGKDELSLQTVRLAEQVQALSRQIQVELQQP